MFWGISGDSGFVLQKVEVSEPQEVQSECVETQQQLCVQNRPLSLPPRITVFTSSANLLRADKRHRVQRPAAVWRTLWSASVHMHETDFHAGLEWVLDPNFPDTRKSSQQSAELLRGQCQTTQARLKICGKWSGSAPEFNEFFPGPGPLPPPSPVQRGLVDIE